MTPDSRRSNQKPFAPRSRPLSDEPTLRDLRTESASKRLLPWMGLILFCTGAVFHAGRLVERLDPQPQHKPALISGLLTANAAGTVATVASPASLAPSAHEPSPEKQQADAEALRKLMAERDQAQEAARVAWQKQVEAEVAAQIARMGEESSQQKQLEADEIAQRATQAAAEAEAKARELEVQLATKTVELQEARLRAENEWLRLELERERAGRREGKALAKAPGEAPADSEGTGPESEPPSLSPTAVGEPLASPEPAQPPSGSEPSPPSSEPSLASETGAGRP
jgi:hypothetical protein